MAKQSRIAILGAGNIGLAIATGLVESGHYKPGDIILTRRKLQALEAQKVRGFDTSDDNPYAVQAADVLIVAVEPQQIDSLLAEIAPVLEPGRHVLISVAAGVDIQGIAAGTGSGVAIVRAMPNTAISIRESMTCLAAGAESESALAQAAAIFDTVGKTLVIDEEQMTAATALGACGVAFFLRAIRAASQGGVEIGFHYEAALAIAAQTARGAASLLGSIGNHPEHEIDRVTTPRGCTIAGLNRMEHAGFSSALIKGITTSAAKAGGLYPDRD